MATHKGYFNFDAGNIKPGDTFTGCNPSAMDGRVIAADNLTFEKCNMFGVTIRPSWTIKDCYHVGKTKADLPPAPTKAEIDAIEIDVTTKKLAELQKAYPAQVEASIKLRPELFKYVPVKIDPSTEDEPIKGGK